MLLRQRFFIKVTHYLQAKYWGSSFCSFQLKISLGIIIIISSHLRHCSRKYWFLELSLLSKQIYIEVAPQAISASRFLIRLVVRHMGLVVASSEYIGLEKYCLNLSKFPLSSSWFPVAVPFNQVAIVEPSAEGQMVVLSLISGFQNDSSSLKPSLTLLNPRCLLS